MISYSIFVTTSDPETKEYRDKRFEYFQRTIESLQKTNADLSTLHIFDDCSEYKPKVEYLNKLKYPKVYLDSIPYMARESTTGKIQTHYKREYREYKTDLCKNIGSMLTTTHAIEFMYHRYDSKYIIWIQDDVIFNKDFIERGKKIFDLIDNDVTYRTGGYNRQEWWDEITRVGFLCLYNRKGSYNEKYYLDPSGHPGGVTWMLKRRCWEDYRNKFKINDPIGHIYAKNDIGRHKIRNLVDHKLATLFHKPLGWDNAKVGKSLVQHIGDRSCLLKGRDMTEHRCNNFVGEG